MKNSTNFLIGFIILITLTGIFAGCTNNNDTINNASNAETKPGVKIEIETTAEPEKEFEEPAEIIPQLVVNLDEKTNMYQFVYKKSVLNMSKEKFDEYNLADDNIQKFFDKMEKVYVLFADFFLVHNLPEIFTYNSVTKDYKESVGANANAFSRVAENATYYVEGLLEGYLKDIDIGFPAIVAHEVGHLFTGWADWDKGIYYNGSTYVWDFEVFAVIATEYLTSLPDFKLISVIGDYVPITDAEYQKIAKEWDGYEEWFKTYQGFIYFKIITIIEKYGYDTLHEVLAEMINRDIRTRIGDAIIGINTKDTFDLFFDIYAEKTGENVKKEFFIQEELDEIYKNI